MTTATQPRRSLPKVRSNMFYNIWRARNRWEYRTEWEGNEDSCHYGRATMWGFWWWFWNEQVIHRSIYPWMIASAIVLAILIIYGLLFAYNFTVAVLLAVLVCAAAIGAMYVVIRLASLNTRLFRGISLVLTAVVWAPFYAFFKGWDDVEQRDRVAHASYLLGWVSMVLLLTYLIGGMAAFMLVLGALLLLGLLVLFFVVAVAIAVGSKKGYDKVTERYPQLRIRRDYSDEVEMPIPTKSRLQVMLAWLKQHTCFKIEVID